ncbi:MAG: hypothetical protein ABH843_08490 [Candidatus Omnitrophota bacterium]
MPASKIKILICLVVFMSLTVAHVFADELKPIKLSEPQLSKGKLLMQALNERQSTRAFSSDELPLEVLSNLLWAAFGIIHSNQVKSGDF